MSANPSEVGFHNADLERATLRVIESGTWKKQRIVMVVPSASMIASKVYLSHCSIMFPPNQAVHRVLAMGCEVGDAYERSIAEIIDNPQHPCHDWEFLLSVESDNCPQPDAVLKLIRRMEQHPEFSAISGLYWCKGANGAGGAGTAHIWGQIADPVVNFRSQPPVPGQLVECYGLSMGITLYRLSMFKDKRLQRPWFKTLTGIEGLGLGTQDLRFWSDAKKYGYRCAVDCDVLVGHWDQAGQYGPAETMW